MHLMSFHLDMILMLTENGEVSNSILLSTAVLRAEQFRREKWTVDDLGFFIWKSFVLLS